jgi:membrane protein DedA with SNARE-associated domain
MKKLIWAGLFVGSTIGGVIPYLWGSYFSFSTVLLSAVGGFIGVWAGYKIGKYFGV